MSTSNEAEVKKLAKSNFPLVKSKKKKKKKAVKAVKAVKDKGSQRKERKATQTLAIVLGKIFSNNSYHNN